MALLNKTGITNGGTIQSEHVTRTIDALTGVSTDSIVATGSFSGSFSGLLTGTASSAQTINTITSALNYSFYPTFVDANNGSAAAETVYTDAGITYNPFTNILTTTASFSTTASYALNAVGSGAEYMTLRLASGAVTGVTSGSTVYVGTGVTGSNISRVGVRLPYGCTIVSASIYVNTPVNVNTTLGTVQLYYDTTGTPVNIANFSNIDVKTVYIDGNSTAVAATGEVGKWINVGFIANNTSTGLFTFSADIVIKKL